MSQQADKITDSIAAALGESKPAFGNAKADVSLEQRLNAIIEERERIERDQNKLRSEAEQELSRISPEIDSLQKQIENLRSKKQNIEGFLQRLAPKGADQTGNGQMSSQASSNPATSSQSPGLRRASFG